MKTKLKIITSCFVMGALISPVLSHAEQGDGDSDRSHPGAFVSDSVITTKIKAKMATEKFSSLTNIRVDTDKDGVVWLSGNADSRHEAEKALQIARSTEGVTSVKDHIKVVKDD